MNAVHCSGNADCLDGCPIDPKCAGRAADHPCGSFIAIQKASGLSFIIVPYSSQCLAQLSKLALVGEGAKDRASGCAFIQLLEEGRDLTDLHSRRIQVKSCIKVCWNLQLVMP